MSLVIENAAFYDPEPEVENFQVSKNICRSRLRKERVGLFKFDDIPKASLWLHGKNAEGMDFSKVLHK